jgi:hypothetical protein
LSGPAFVFFFIAERSVVARLQTGCITKAAVRERPARRRRRTAITFMVVGDRVFG